MTIWYRESYHSGVAQSVEQLTVNQRVTGSSPVTGAEHSCNPLRTSLFAFHSMQLIPDTFETWTLGQVTCPSWELIGLRIDTSYLKNKYAVTILNPELDTEHERIVLKMFNQSHCLIFPTGQLESVLYAAGIRCDHSRCGTHHLPISGDVSTCPHQSSGETIFSVPRLLINRPSVNHWLC